MGNISFKEIVDLAVTRFLRIAKSCAVNLVSGATMTFESGSILKLFDGVALAATSTEINRACDVSGRLVAAGSALSLTVAEHDGKTVLFDTATGSVITLPAATGTGARFRCVVSVLATSNAHVLQVVGTDIMQGSIGIIDTDTSDATVFFATETTSDTVTFNRTTSGLAAPGDYVEVEDVATGVWAVRGVAQASGVVITPFSAAVPA